MLLVTFLWVMQKKPQKILRRSRKDKSVTEEMEALGDLEAYATSVTFSTDMKVDPQLFLTHINNIRSAITVHRNRSEDYIRRLEQESKFVAKHYQM
jgi:hypothetical protein